MTMVGAKVESNTIITGVLNTEREARAACHQLQREAANRVSRAPRRDMSTGRERGRAKEKGIRAEVAEEKGERDGDWYTGHSEEIQQYDRRRELFHM